MIDDDQELCQLLTEFLTLEGFSVTAVHEGKCGVETALSGDYQLILLDVTLPKLNGFEVLKRIRQQSQIPILMLTARGDDVDRIIGLEIGADDYLPKPFNHRELVARIKAILRRSESVVIPESGPSVMEIDDLTINLLNREIKRNGQLLEMTATEFVVLKILVQRSGMLVERGELTRLALGRRLMQYDRAIDMHVSNVRRKIREKPDGSPRIKTVRGSGYFYITE